MSVFVMSNRNVVIPSPDGKTSVRLSRGQMGPVPDWAPGTAYFKALAADGKLIVSESKSDRELEKGRKAAERARRKAEEEARKKAEEEAAREEAERGTPEDEAPDGV